VALAGGPDANFIIISTADTEIDAEFLRQSSARDFGIKYVTVVHTRDRVRADSSEFVDPLRHASAVWIDGGPQSRLADVYLGTAVEREIKALLARGGVVGGGSVGAAIQGSFLVHAATAPGHETGFGLLPNSAIATDAPGRENDLRSAISAHPELLGIGIDQGGGIVVHGDSFFNVTGQVTIHDAKKRNGPHSFLLSDGHSFNLTTRLIDSTGGPDADENYPLMLIVLTPTRYKTQEGYKTLGKGALSSKNSAATQPVQPVNFECDVSLYNSGRSFYVARLDGPNQLKIIARAVNSDELREYTGKY